MSASIASFSSAYLDTNTLIYFIERDDELQRKVGQFVAKAVAANAQLFVSEIGIAECFYGTYKKGEDELFAAYEHIFSEQSVFEILSIDGRQLIAAAKLGAEKGLKLVDAVHFQVAVEISCEIFVTNDRRFQSSHGLTVLQLSEL